MVVCGVVLVVCLCVSASGVLFSVGVCACVWPIDLLTPILHRASTGDEGTGVVLVVCFGCVFVCLNLFSLWHPFFTGHLLGTRGSAGLPWSSTVTAG